MINLVLGDQLFPSWENADKADEFLLIESKSLATRYRYHKQKLVLTFACMREFAASLKTKGFKVHYVKIDSELGAKPYFTILEESLKRLRCNEIRVAELADRSFSEEFFAWTKKKGIAVVHAQTELFLTPSNLFPDAFRKRPFMKTFYEWQRSRLGILVNDQKSPVGGKWSFDTENRKKLPKTYTAPVLPRVDHSPIVKEVIAVVDQEFKDHPGEAYDFWLPASSKEAKHWLKNFLDWRLEQFGPYEDVIKAGDIPEEDILNHSALSPLMNVGLLPVAYVIKRTLDCAEKKKIPLASLEGFVRQIIGWREFIKGIDLIYGEEEARRNFFKHKRKLKECWYTGTTGLEPVDAAIRKTLRRGYNHHIERLMILSNVMLLSEVDPVEVHRWFMEMFVDSSEWVMGPNVFGMGQFSDGGIFATKPYICGSNYILKMGDHQRGEWCDTWDGLYWNFIEKNSGFFLKNPRTGMAGRLLSKIPEAKLARHRALAKAFQEKTTNPG